jgi:hypothetical protein
MFTTLGRNSMLDSLLSGSYYAALFTAYPGQLSSNEVAGGSPAYARKGVTFGASSAGVRTSTGPVVFDVPGGPTTVNWIGFSTSVSGNTTVAISPNGGNPKEYFLDNVANTLYCPAHGITGGATITVYGATPPTGLTEGTTYVAVAAGITADTLQVALVATPTVPIALTGQPGVGALLSPIVPESFGSQGTFTLAAGATLNLNY